VFLRVRTRSRATYSSKAKRNAIAALDAAGLNDHPLWLALQAKRLELAQNENVPPYVIFQDDTLIDVLISRPKNLAELSSITSLEKFKLDRYGKDLLQVLQNQLYENETQESIAA
jgi:ATP-dependent DNA helicase RecQ